MENNIIVDSSLDYNRKYLEDQMQITRIPFKINISKEEIVDGTISSSIIIAKMKLSKGKITTACPSPQQYLDVLEKKKNNYIVTISSKLSGSYNSAMSAKMIAKQENLGKTTVIDTKSAGPAQGLVVIKLIEEIKKGLDPDKIFSNITKYISELKTTFVLNSLDNLAKNGRISNLEALMGKLLQITPIMGDDGDGNIELKEKTRGKENSFNHLKQMIEMEAKNKINKILAITHVNAKEKAERLKEDMKRKCIFKKILIFEAGGLSTVYADDGGIITTY